MSVIVPPTIRGSRKKAGRKKDAVILNSTVEFVFWPSSCFSKKVSPKVQRIYKSHKGLIDFLCVALSSL